jgi:hypothetical protein
MTNFGKKFYDFLSIGKSFSIQYLYKNKFIFNFVIFVAKKKEGQLFFSAAFCCCCWVREPRSGMDKIQDTGFATLEVFEFTKNVSIPQ